MASAEWNSKSFHRPGKVKSFKRTAQSPAAVRKAEKISGVLARRLPGVLKDLPMLTLRLNSGSLASSDLTEPPILDCPV